MKQKSFTMVSALELIIQASYYNAVTSYLIRNPLVCIKCRHMSEMAGICLSALQKEERLGQGTDGARGAKC